MVRAPGGALAPGEPLKGVIVLSQHSGAAVIPRGAVLYDQEHPYVFLAVKSVAHRRDVVLGASDNDRVEVTSGLTVGDRVVVDGASALDDGMWCAKAPPPRQSDAHDAVAVGSRPLHHSRLPAPDLGRARRGAQPAGQPFPARRLSPACWSAWTPATVRPSRWNSKSCVRSRKRSSACPASSTCARPPAAARPTSRSTSTGAATWPRRPAGHPGRQPVACPSLPQGTTFSKSGAWIRRCSRSSAYSLSSVARQPVAALRHRAIQLRPLLAGIPGVARAEVVGGAQEEYQVIVDPARLVAYDLSLIGRLHALSGGQRRQGGRPDRGPLQALSRARRHALPATSTRSADPSRPAKATGWCGSTMLPRSCAASRRNGCA